jgi:type I restriction enzyme M protein
MTEIARRLGIGVSAVSNWRRRYASFPAGLAGSLGETFDVGELSSWLAGRSIPSSARQPDEPPGTTYAERFEQTVRDVITANRPGVPDSISDDELRLLVEKTRNRSELGDAIIGLLVLRFWFADVFAEMVAAADERREGRFAELLERYSDSGVGLLLPNFREGSSDLLGFGRIVQGVNQLRLADHASRAELGLLVLRLVDMLAMDSAKKGDHYAPSSLVRLMVQLTEPSRGSRVHDPFCRAGELLAGVVVSSPPDVADNVELTGSAVNSRFSRMSRAALMLTGASPRIELRDVLTSSPGSSSEYDVVLANPPYNVKLDDVELDGRDIRWSYGPPPANNTNFLWLQHILAVLAQGGRAAVLMPNQATFSENVAERRIRNAMIADGVVECIVALPTGLFPSTSIGVSLWLLRSPRVAIPAEVLFVDASNLGTAGRGRRVLSDTEVDRIVDECRNWRAPAAHHKPSLGFAAAIPISELVESRFGLNPRAYVLPTTPPTDPVERAIDVGDLLRQRDEAHQRMQDLRRAADSRGAAVEWSSAGVSRSSRQVSLGEVCELTAGPGRFEDDPRGAAHKVVTPRALRHNRIVDTGVVAAPSNVSASRYFLVPGDVVCVRVGQLGRQGVVGSDQVGWLVGPGCLRLRPGPDVDPTYLACCLASSSVREWIQRHATGSAVQSMSMRTFGELPLALPALGEQRRIAAVLASLDDEEAALEHARETTSQLRDLMVDLLVPLAAPVRRGGHDPSGGRLEHG